MSLVTRQPEGHAMANPDILKLDMPPKRSQHVEEILRPVALASPAGLFVEDDETFLAIDHEMVKAGGLHQSSLDWQYVQEASASYLAVHCKHFRIAGHLIASWLRTNAWADWAQAAGLAAGMAERYWESGFPKPGITGQTGKRKYVQQWLDRLGQTLNTLDSTTYSADAHWQATQVLNDALQFVEDRKLDPAAFHGLIARLDALAKDAVTPAPAAGSAASATALSLATSGAIESILMPATTDVSLGNEREARRSLLKVAEYLCAKDAYDPAGYLARRLALWSSILTPPLVKKGNRTELMCVPADFVRGYREALISNALDLRLLADIEKTVVSSPFWLQGSYLVSAMAAKLQMREVAQAIRSACHRFVTRLPMLRELQFQDGTPFVDDVTAGWLDLEDGGPPAVTGGHIGAPSLEYGELRRELAVCLEQHGIEVVLQRVQELQGDKTSPRHRYYATVMAADALAGRGFSWLARNMYTLAHNAMNELDAKDWEPELYRHLSSRAQIHEHTAVGAMGARTINGAAK
jgi:type VI secretion system protein VasJ